MFASCRECIFLWVCGRKYVGVLFVCVCEIVCLCVCECVLMCVSVCGYACVRM